MAAAKLPVVKDIDAFRVEGTPINEGLVRSLHSGVFLPARGMSSWLAARVRYDRKAVTEAS